MDSTDSPRWLSPLARRAAAGELPEWACVTPKRRKHIERVVALLDDWAAALDLPEEERERWRAIGWLHDSLKNAEQEQFREGLPPNLQDLPRAALHGPAAAEKLRDELDAAALHAIRFHTLGHTGLDAAGRMLYMADFLEPGKKHRPKATAALRKRMPEERDDVLVEVVAMRIERALERRRALRPETADFWSSLVESDR